MTCSNCGHEFTGGYCPQCGRPVIHFSGQSGAIALLVLLVAPSAFVGACSLQYGLTFNPATSGVPIGTMATMVGLGALFVCAFGLFWVGKLWRK